MVIWEKANVATLFIRMRHLFIYLNDEGCCVFHLFPLRTAKLVVLGSLAGAKHQGKNFNFEGKCLAHDSETGERILAGAALPPALAASLTLRAVSEWVDCRTSLPCDRLCASPAPGSSWF